MTNSIRKKIYDFFTQEPEKDKFIETLKWILFEEFSESKDFINLASCPNCGTPNIKFLRENLSDDYLLKCSKYRDMIYLTDIFRLHEVIDNELGADGILGYLIVSIEQIYLIHLIRIILNIKPSLLNEILFIKDDPLAFFWTNS